AVDDYIRLFNTLVRTGRYPTRIVHAWTTDWAAGGSMADQSNQDVERGIESLRCLAQTLAQQADGADIRVTGVSTGTQSVRGDESLLPTRAGVLGLSIVISQEQPRLCCRCVDIEPVVGERAGTLEAVATELLSDADEPAAALRGGRRWVQEFEMIPS